MFAETYLLISFNFVPCLLMLNIGCNSFLAALKAENCYVRNDSMKFFNKLSPRRLQTVKSFSFSFFGPKACNLLCGSIVYCEINPRTSKRFSVTANFNNNFLYRLMFTKSLWNGSSKASGNNGSEGNSRKLSDLCEYLLKLASKALTDKNRCMQSLRARSFFVNFYFNSLWWDCGCAGNIISRTRKNSIFKQTRKPHWRRF